MPRHAGPCLHRHCSQVQELCVSLRSLAAEFPRPLEVHALPPSPKPQDIADAKAGVQRIFVATDHAGLPALPEVAWTVDTGVAGVRAWVGAVRGPARGGHAQRQHPPNRLGSRRGWGGRDQANSRTADNCRRGPPPLDPPPMGCISTAVHRRRRGVTPPPPWTPPPWDVLERPYTAGGGGSPPPLLPFHCLRLTAKIMLWRLWCQEDLSFKNFGPPSAGTIGGPLEEGGSQPNPLTPLLRPTEGKAKEREREVEREG